MKSDAYDLVCIGGGPAGMAVALWARDIGLRACVLEREATLGGQLNIIHNPINNYPGRSAQNGAEILDELDRQLSAVGGDIRTSASLEKVSLDQMEITLGSGETIRGASMIIATGIRRRELGISGEQEFRGKGILDSGAASRDKVVGQRVVVVGGGDAAVENALILAEKASVVTLIHRRDSFSARRDFVRKAETHQKIRLMTNAAVREILGADSVTSVIVKTPDVSNERIDADSVLIRIGWTPNSELFEGMLELDELGYIITDAECRTSVPNAYAIGDVRRRTTPTISGAVGDAATAVKMIAAGTGNRA